MEVIGNGGYKHRKEYARKEGIVKQTENVDLEKINEELLSLRGKVKRLDGENAHLQERIFHLEKVVNSNNTNNKVGDRELASFRGEIKKLKQFRDWTQRQFDRFYKEFDERILYSLEKNKELQQEQLWQQQK